MPCAFQRCFSGLCLFLAALVWSPTAAPVVAAEPSYAEWRAACAKLPLNRVLGGRPPPRDLLPLKSFAELEQAIDGFFALSTNGPLAGATNWVGPAPRADTFLDVTRSWFVPPEIPFEPFAQKLVLPAGAKVFLEGDLHGDIHSLLRVLDRLHERRWLDGFTLTEPDRHVIFLGDYTDRGLYGVEVLYTLLRLKLANPQRVHFVRGNHEDVTLVARYGFLAEAQAKFGRGFNAAKLLRAYDFLPVVLYLGSGTDFVQLCHGGMEPGFSPAGLLAAAGTNRFQLLGPLRQAEFLRRHPDWLKGDPAAASEARAQFRDFVPAAPTSPGVIGFMWNDFTVFGDEPAFAHNPDRAFVYGQPAVQALLQATGPGDAKVRAVIRAHQHSGMLNPIMHRLILSRGLFRHWQETNAAAAAKASLATLANRLETGASRALPEGSVWTFNVAPDSVYGQGCNFSFATFGVLTLANNFADWRIAVETVDVPTR